MHILTYSLLYIEIVATVYESILQSRHGELNQDCLAATAGTLLQVKFHISWATSLLILFSGPFSVLGLLILGFLLFLTFIETKD